MIIIHLLRANRRSDFRSPGAFAAVVASAVGRFVVDIALFNPFSLLPAHLPVDRRKPCVRQGFLRFSLLECLQLIVLQYFIDLVGIPLEDRSSLVRRH